MLASSRLIRSAGLTLHQPEPSGRTASNVRLKPTGAATIPSPLRSIDRRLFQQQWWHEAAAGDLLETAEVRWDGAVVGSLPYVRDRAFGIRMLKLPPYSRTQSPLINLPEAKPSTYDRNVRRIIAGLIHALPEHDRFQFALYPEDQLSFHFWVAGCSIQEGFTFRLPSGTDLDQHWLQLDQKTRNLIRTAGRHLSVEQSANVQTFIDLSNRQHGPKRNRHNFPAMRRLVETATARHQATVLSAKDGTGAIVAVSILVWDDEVLFYWQSSRHPDKSAPGANSLLIWRAIEIAMERGLIFDLDGAFSEAGAVFAGKFGFHTVVRPYVVHASLLGNIAQAIALGMGRERSI